MDDKQLTHHCMCIHSHLRCRAENAFHPLPPALEPSFLQGIVTGYGEHNFLLAVHVG